MLCIVHEPSVGQPTPNTTNQARRAEDDDSFFDREETPEEATGVPTEETEF